MTYIAKAAAKINLAIDVLSKRPDGFHEVVMIMQTVALYDTISLKPTAGGEIEIMSDSKYIPTDQNNIVYKTAEYLKLKYNVKKGALIEIQKMIPIAAGLAGGSADAAATIKLLNKAWDLKLSKNEMLEAGKKIGSDVPFCIQGGTALAEGLGERLTSLKSLPECYILLAKPPVSISTKQVYAGIDFADIKEKPDIKEMIQGINEGNIVKISNKLCNVLENVTIKKCPIIEELKAKLIEFGAIGSMMSGSGPTVFGIFEDQVSAYNAYDHIKTMVNEIFVVKTESKTWDNI